MQRSRSIQCQRIHIRTFGNEEFGDFLGYGMVQRSPSGHMIVIFLIYIHAFVQFRLDTSKVPTPCSIVNRVSEGGCGQQRGNREC